MTDAYEAKYPGGGPILRFLLHPALPFYRLVVAGEGDLPDLVIDFLPPRYGDVKRFSLKNGLHADVITTVHFYGAGIPSDVVVCLGAAKENAMEYNRFSAYVVRKPEMLSPDMAEGMAWMGLCLIQDALIERPAIFHTQLTRRMTATHEFHRSLRKKKVKVVKVITVVPDALVPTIPCPSKRAITCPCWGVAGHWRTYKKSGKRVWVDSYLKGKRRNDHAAYESKEYQIVMKGETSHA